MSTPLQVGITGGIGSGKSLVSQILHCLGVPVYDADSRAKKLMTTDGILVRDIQKEFGNLAFDSAGNLNRKWLAEVVFKSPDKLQTLNRLIHPRVRVDYRQWVEENTQTPYLLKEAALLYEAGSANELDKIIVVTAPEKLRIARVLARDPHRTEADVKNIMKNQMPESEKVRRADFVVNNDENHMVIPQVLELHQRLLARN